MNFRKTPVAAVPCVVPLLKMLKKTRCAQNARKTNGFCVLFFRVRSFLRRRELLVRFSSVGANLRSLLITASCCDGSYWAVRELLGFGVHVRLFSMLLSMFGCKRVGRSVLGVLVPRKRRGRSGPVGPRSRTVENPWGRSARSARDAFSFRNPLLQS